MAKVKSITFSVGAFVKAKMGDYAQLFKLRLSTLVVFSALMGYLTAGIHESGSGLLLSLLVLSLGGFLVTGASNAINQIIEKDVDKLMERTATRPLPTERMTVLEAAFLTGICAISGILLLTLYFNPLTGLLAAVSMISYGFMYTPMKRVSSIAVFIGAIPGALPPIIGYVAVTNKITHLAVLLFLIQFIWQFPHFWAIAWLKYEDYRRAGIMLLPSKEGKTKFSALMNVVYIIALIFAGFMLFTFNQLNLVGTLILTATGLFFLAPAARLYFTLDDKDAKKLMFASFLYLPVSLLVVLFDKVI